MWCEYARTPYTIHIIVLIAGSRREKKDSIISRLHQLALHSIYMLLQCNSVRFFSLRLGFVSFFDRNARDCRLIYIAFYNCKRFCCFFLFSLFIMISNSVCVVLCFSYFLFTLFCVHGIMFMRFTELNTNQIKVYIFIYDFII